MPPPDPVVRLAVRNLPLGTQVGLPSGQQVAAALSVNALPNASLGLSDDPRWGGQAPLWFYILKEAELPPFNTERRGGTAERVRHTAATWQRGPGPHRMVLSR